MALQMIAQATVPDGYNGHTADIGIALLGTVIVAVSRYGYYRLGLPDAATTAEALWLVKNHPTARNIRLREVAL